MMDVGSVAVRLGFISDDKGFREHEQLVVRAQRVQDIKTRLGGDFDERAFKAYEQQLERTKRRVSQREAFKATLGADFDERGFRAYQRELDKAERSAHAMQKTNDDLVRGSGRLRTAFGTLFVGGAGVAAGAGLFYGLARGAQAVVGAFRESERVGRQTEAVLKSTGGQAGVTAKHVGDLATRISQLTGVDDELVQQGENVLLTFTNVRNEVGKGNDVFDQATGLALDMSKALGTDLQSSVIQVGKALQDPVKGVTALQRVGVSFTKQQRDQIAALGDSGRSLDAQKIVLGELRKEFGGTAQATATNSDRLKVSIGNVAESIGGELAPTVDKGAGALNRLIGQMRSGNGEGGRLAAGFRRVTAVVGGVFTRVFDAASTLVRDNRGRLQDLGDTLGGLAGKVGGALGSIARAFRSTFGSGSGTGRDIRSIVSNMLDLAGTIARVAAAITERALPGIVTAFRGLAQIIRGVIRIISGILSGDFAKAWDGVKDIFDGGIKIIAGSLRAGTAPLRAAAAAVGHAVGHAFSSAWDDVVHTAQGFVNKIIDVINIIPGIPDIKHVGGGDKGTGAQKAAFRPGTRSVGKYAEGGKVTMPVAIMGEEAPQHPEWVIPTNPAYRARAVDLWMLAAREIGIPGFARGGRLSLSDLAALWRREGGSPGAASIMAHIAQAESGGDPRARNPSGASGLWQILGLPFPGDPLDPETNARMAIAKSSNGRNLHPWDASRAAWARFVGRNDVHGGGGGLLGKIGHVLQGAVGSVAGFVGDLVGKLPGNPGGILKGTFGYVLGKAKDYIAGKAKGLLGIGGDGGGADASAASSGGLVAQVQRALAWARGHGWHGSVTSGYRSTAKQQYLWDHASQLGLVRGVSVARPGSSEHERGRAVDVTDVDAFKRAMAGAPPGSRLLWRGPSDPVHFSVSGHRRGGILSRIGGRLGGEQLAGGALAYRTGGRTPAITNLRSHKLTANAKTKHGPVLTAKENRGITRSVARGEAGITSFESEIQRLERQYSQKDREFGLSDEVFLIENDDGSTTVDQGAVDARVSELDQLAALRAKIRHRTEAYRTAIKKLQAALTKAIKKLQAALNAATGKARAKERAGYRDAIATYQARRSELRDVFDNLGLDLEDDRIDLEELAGERAQVAGSTATPATPEPAEPAAPAAAPSPADIAAAAITDVGRYLTAQQTNLSAYASNFITPFQATQPGGVFSGTPDQLAALAGTKYLGAGGDTTLGADPGRSVVIHNTYLNPPDNTATWSSQMRFQIEAAVG